MILSAVVMMAVVSCDRNHEQTDAQPIAYFKASPLTGSTTTIFHFDADSTTGQGTRESPVLVRWDWESDGVWDWMYTTGGKLTHRFFKPGTYRILMEASTLSGRCDSISTIIEVIRGYSPPRVAFTMTPDSANILNEFAFDASLTKDDEDSLDQLMFRWDFEGDMKWDTDFSANPVARHTYSADQNYIVRLEARDPRQMTSIGSDTLKVTRYNDKIVATATYSCWPCTLEDTVRFDATGSFYDGNPEAPLLFSWDISDDNVWESVLSENRIFQRRIGIEGKTAFRLRVTDEEGLYMDFVDTVELFQMNMAPVARLVIGNRIGNTGSTYYLHLRGSTDRDNSYMDLKTRWDIDNDGEWEDAYNDLFEVRLTFSSPGKYPITARVSDPNGKFSEDTDTIWVVPGQHETGLLEDKRTGGLPDYYGTVKIGNRWWMQSNLMFAPTGKKDTWSSDYYNNDQSMGSRYGALYPQTATISSQPVACPRGWHVPSLQEWEQLMADLSGDATIERLLEGGQSEMHVILAGQKDFNYISPNLNDKFSGLGSLTRIWTSTITSNNQAYVWYIDPVRGQNKSVVVSKTYWLPIRCIKDE